MSKWLTHVKDTLKQLKKKNPGALLGDAMKVAKKTYKKGGQMVEGEKMEGGVLMGLGTPMGGKRTKKHKGGQCSAGGSRRRRKHRGGQLYSQAGGPYADSILTDGAAPFIPYDLTSMQWQGRNPNAMTGGTKRRRRHHRK